MTLKKILHLMLLGTFTITCCANTESSYSCHVAATNQFYPCSVGKTGVRSNKIEGDKATPTGRYLIREFFYRADKLTPEQVNVMQGLQQRGFKVRTLTPDDAWIDDVNSPYYNQFAKISSFKGTPPKHEKLWQKSNEYDIMGVIGYNDNPVIKGKGSALFLHIARLLPTGGYAPTVGCIALPKKSLLKVLNVITPKTEIDIPTQGKIITFSVESIVAKKF